MPLISSRFTRASRIAFVIAAAACLACATPSRAADPTIVSTVPALGDSGVSASAPIIFTFSAAMDTTATEATFLDTNFTTLTVTSAWSADQKTLTCTPAPAFPNPDEIIWSVDGQDTMGNSLQGQTSGFYTIGSGGGGGGGNPCTTVSYTNTSFTINESWLFDQTSSATPTPDPQSPYDVIAEVTLISNLTATAATVTSPNNTVTDLQSLGFGGHIFLASDNETSSAALNAAWPSGNYTFNVSGSSLPAVTVAWNIAQPNVPQLANFAALAAVDSTKPLTLTWNAFTSRVGTNEIFINIGYNSCAGTGFYTNLPGTATSVLIPAGTLAPGSNYLNSTLGFINAAGADNASPKYTVGGSHGSITSFTLTTIGGGVSGPVTFGAPVWSGATLTLPLTAPPGKTITIQTSTSLTPSSWTTLTTTNTGSGTITITDTPSKTVPYRFYRAHL